MTHKENGIVAAVVGVGLVAATWYLALKQGQYYVLLCLLGPVALFNGVAMILLPPQKLFERKEEIVNGVSNVTYDNKKMTALGWVITLFGIAVGGLQIAYFHYGF